MSRTKEYELDDVLQAVTELFWSKGYEATSMNDVVTYSGLNKHSLYKEFGDKEGLFLACLDFYATKMNQELGEILTKEPLGLSNIKDFFADRVRYAKTKDCRGCFLVNSISDKDVVSEEVNQKIQSMLSFSEDLFYHCLVAAQKQGEVARQKDCRVLAAYLSCVLRGLMSMGRSKSSKVSEAKLVDVAMSVVTH